MLARRTRVFNEVGVKKIVAPARTASTPENGTRAGREYEVYHHTELLAHLVRPAAAASSGRTWINFHDPLYLGRHKRVFAAPGRCQRGRRAAAGQLETT